MVMKVLRRSTKPIIWIVAFTFIGTIFLAWGMNLSRRPGEKGVIGKVAGQEIHDEQYRQVVDNLYYQQNQRDPGKELNDSDARKMRDDAFNGIVQDVLFGGERRRLGLDLTDEELVEHLRRFPPEFVRSAEPFQTNGQFDYAKYQQTMLDPQYGQFWAQVEGLVRPQLKQIKLQEYAISLAHVTDPEVKTLYESAEGKRKVRYVPAFIADFAERVTSVDSVRVKASYDGHQDKYYRNETAELDFVALGKTPSAEDTAVVTNEITELRQRILGGEDFAALARQYSDDQSSAPSGGDLGWFGHKRMVAAFDSAAFALDTGKVSLPIRTRFGVHLIRVYEKRRVNDSDQVHAAHILQKIEVSGRTLNDLHVKAQQFIEDLDQTPFDSAASTYGFRSRTTGRFERGQPIPGLGEDKLIEEFAFRSKIGAASSIIDKDKYMVICRLKARHPAGIPLLGEIWPQVAQDVKLEMGADSALADINKIENEIKAGKSLADAAKTYSRIPVETQFFGRFESLPDVGVDPVFHGIAFALTETKPVSPVFKAGEMYCLMELMAQQAPDVEIFTAKRDSVFQVVLNGKRNQVYQLWYEDLLKKAQVQDFRYQLSDAY